MALEKLKITPFKKRGATVERGAEIEALFNPNTYTITKTVAWNVPKTNEGDTTTNNQFNAPTLSFGGGASSHLTLDLFFDVTEPVVQKGLTKVFRDVRDLTDQIVALTRIDRNQSQPPVCEVMWGSGPKPRKDFPFIGVIGSLTQRFTLFHENGSPLRATLTVDFTEFLDPTIDKRKTDPEQTAHTIKRGETLSSITGELYNDPTLWRIIAEANGVDDPRQLTVGQTLAIPKYGQG